MLGCCFSASTAMNNPLPRTKNHQLTTHSMVVRQDIDNSSALVTVTLTRDEYKPKVDAELKRYRQKAPIKGFRPGQAPMDFVKRMYGNALFGEVMQDLFAEQLVAHLREARLDVLGQPLPSEDQPRFTFNINQPEASYAIQYEVGFVPKFELRGLDKNETYDRLVVSDLDQLAETDLQETRKRAQQRVSVEDNIQENDMLRIAARELDGDTVKEGGWETTIPVLVSSVADEDLKAQLLSLKKGDTLRFNPRHIENQGKEELYRKYILSLQADDDRVVSDSFEGVIEDVSRILAEAELNEAFFQENFGTPHREEAMGMLKAGIAQFYEVRSNALLMRRFQERLMELNQIEMPEKFLKRWLRVTNEEGRLSEESLEAEYPAFAENLRWTVIRDDIKAEFGIEVTEQELRAVFLSRIKSYFRNSGLSGADLPDSVFASTVDRLMHDKEDVEKTRREIETDKIFEAILSQVTVQDVPVPSEELHRILDEAAKKAEAEQSSLLVGELGEEMPEAMVE